MGIFSFAKLRCNICKQGMEELSNVPASQKQKSTGWDIKMTYGNSLKILSHKFFYFIRFNSPLLLVDP